MKVEREVIIDLLPAYFSGESSAATRTLVEDYFRENPDFEAAARRSNDSLEGLKVLSAAADDAKEKLALERARQITETKTAFLWLAWCFTLMLPLFRIHNRQIVWILWEPSPIVGVIFALMASFFWLLYLNVRRFKEPLRPDRKFLWLACFYTVLLLLPDYHNHQLGLFFFWREAPDVGMIFAVISAALWVTYFYQRWKARPSRQ
jgi:threonine/homoserine efflux transporter RhtA